MYRTLSPLSGPFGVSGGRTPDPWSQKSVGGHTSNLPMSDFPLIVWKIVSIIGQELHVMNFEVTPVMVVIIVLVIALVIAADMEHSRRGSPAYFVFICGTGQLFVIPSLRVRWSHTSLQTHLISFTSYKL